MFDDPLAAEFAGRLPGWMRARDPVAGQPFLLGPDGRPDSRVNAFFTSRQIRVLDEDTWRKYAYALGLWLNFLVARGVGWVQAVPHRGEEPGPLFCSVAKGGRIRLHGLSGTDVYRQVRPLGERIGARARPHGVRHSSITGVPGRHTRRQRQRGRAG
jgi:hypothetical protein